MTRGYRPQPDDLIWLPVKDCPSHYRKFLPRKRLGKREFVAMDQGTFRDICTERGIPRNEIRFEPHPRHEGRCLATVVYSMQWKDSQAHLGLQRLSRTALPDRHRRRRPAERLRDATARLLSTEQRRRDLRDSGHDNEKGREYDFLLKHPDVQSISVSEKDTITIRTGLIRISWRRHTYRIGQFEIKIPTKFGPWGDDLNTMIVFVNLAKDDLRNGHPHPHVGFGGGACFGNIKTQIRELMRKREFGKVILLCLKFLNSYNSENPFAAVGHWPKDRKNGGRR